MSPSYVSFGEAIPLFFKNYTNFSGRSTRSEYWWFVLFNVLIGIAIIIIGVIAEPLSYIGYIWELAILVPSLALAIRRLHDIGKSGWWLLIGLIPLVGAIILLVFYCQSSDGSNQWGEPAV